jgi:Sigma-70, region 4
MPSLDSLPGDQRAVLQLVLGRGRSYEEIARMLSISSSAVRDRALAALSALGPQTSVSPENQARIADYLLGQLSDQEAEQVRDLLADSPSERAWARVLSSELAPLSSGPLPEIPVERSGPRPEPEPLTPPPSPESAPFRAPPPADASSPADAPPTGLGAAPEPAQETRRGRRRRREPEEPAAAAAAGAPRSSRLGGIVVIVTAVVVVAVVLVLVLRGGGGKHHAASTPTTATTATTTVASTTSTTSTSSSAAKVLAQINLSPPSTSTGSKTAGIAEVLSEGSTDGIAIVAQNVPANTAKPPNAYAVWLYNSPTDATILGFVNPGVGKTGRLSTAGPLPSNASHYKELIVALETSGKPKTPGRIILEGTLTGL